ncbi:P2 family phage major capsid protein [Vibrio vulnificus]|uniref:P2 family phage major capsid protein n=1 Tax=Vibrio vulnificus TaxID=672 RepID=UPI00102A4812|nr:P2 family phage major capsid protein [Vibrio vulnificus]RZP89597.1 major capsid protein [Vibrio vulnificus]RZR41899.1 major capsid protein [Vibrio vulnificus]
MNPITQKRYADYIDNRKQKYSVNDTSMFNVPEAFILDEFARIKQTDEFLSKINIVSVESQSGFASGLGTGLLIAAKTDTNHNTRIPRTLKPVSQMNYLCHQVNFDTALPFETIDSLALRADFQGALDAELQKLANLDLIRLGFFGETIEPDSDPVNCPNGEDVAKGWIQALRSSRPDSILKGASGTIKVGKGGDYETVNALVSAVKKKIAPLYRNVNDLVVLLGSDFVEHDQANFFQRQIDPNKSGSQIELRQLEKSYAALPAFMPSCFPARGVMVTSLNNLSIYFWMKGVRKNFLKKNDGLNRMENFESACIDYVVERLDKAAAVEFKEVQMKEGDMWQ